MWTLGISAILSVRGGERHLLQLARVRSVRLLGMFIGVSPTPPSPDLLGRLAAGCHRSPRVDHAPRGSAREQALEALAKRTNHSKLGGSRATR